MKVAEIRECLHRYIDKVEEKKVKAIYTLFEEEIYQVGEDYSDAFKAELDRRYMEYKQGGEVISMEEADREIDKLLKKARKK